MASPDPPPSHQDTADVKEEEDQPTHTEGDRHKQDDTGVTVTAKQQVSEDTENGDGGHLEQADVKSENNVDENSTHPPADDGGEGDDCQTEDHVSMGADRDPAEGGVSAVNRPCPGENLNVVNDSSSSQAEGGEGEGEVQPPTCADTQSDHVDGPWDRPDEELPATDADVHTGVRRRPGTVSAPEEEEEGQLTAEKFHNWRSEVENIGPTTEETTEHLVPEVTGGRGGTGLLIAAALVLVGAAILVQHLLQPQPPLETDVPQIDVFLRRMERVQSQFPRQRPELWSRSRIHLQRHLQTARPTEPVSLLLTAGLGAKRTLFCLAQDLASAFSSALNASVLHIDGASKVGQDSDQVKLDIDGELQSAFEGDTAVAVIHRFEELPPGATLIFYRYCDHENAAYKNTLLIFTVLLGEEEISLQSSLSTVEEMVDDHLQKKFLTHGRPVAFDRMDLDKYGGLWSRISHLILPVAAEGRIEQEGC